MSRQGAIVLDGGERLRRAVAELPAAEREATAARRGRKPRGTQRAADRDWLGGMPSTMARWARRLPWGTGDRRLYLRAARSGNGAGPGTRGEGR